MSYQDFQAAKLIGQTLVHDIKTGIGRMHIDGVLVLPPGSLIELPTGPSRESFHAVVKNVRLLAPRPVPGGQGVMVCLDCEYPDGWTEGDEA